jgi:hypothetical protein
MRSAWPDFTSYTLSELFELTHTAIIKIAARKQ